MTLQIKDKESKLEERFRREVLKHGGVPRKYVSPGQAGVPDRLVYWPRGVTTYAEVKRDEDEKPSKLQEEEIALLQGMGHLAMVVRSELDIALFIKRSLDRVRAA